MARARYAKVEDMLAALEPSYPVYCLRPSVLRRSARRFLASFPGRVLYAVKCNPHPLVLRALHEAGISHFDTASLPEIALVRELFHDAEAYFHHPVKGRAQIESAHRVYGIRHYVVDHPVELAKLREATRDDDDIVALVRLATPGGLVEIDLSAKFGASPQLAAELLEQAAGAGMSTGLAFHVGSQCLSPGAYRTALEVVGEVLERAPAPLRFLNVGGGFPALYPNMRVAPLDEFLKAISEAVEALDLPAECELMCEPGRAMVADGCSLVVQVQLRKERQLYINDGVFGSLSELVATRIMVPARLIRLNQAVSHESAYFTLFGPTCDSADVLPRRFRLPEDVREGDWIEFHQLGAYSNAAASRFNGFFPETFVEIEDGETADDAADRKSADAS
jgi:ornithine decarboxylase